MLHAKWFQTLCPLHHLAESCASANGQHCHRHKSWCVTRKPLLMPHLYCYNTHGVTSNTWRLYGARIRCLSWRILVITCTMTHCTCPPDSDFLLWTVWGLLARQDITQPRNLFAPCQPSLDDHHTWVPSVICCTKWQFLSLQVEILVTMTIMTGVRCTKQAISDY
jgi:hypothetical protein